MPQPIGEFVKPDSNGGPRKPVVSEITGGSSDGEIRPPEPQIISGYEAFEPATERINTGAGIGGGSGADAGGGGSTPRITKSGRIDRRTLRGKSDSGAATEKASSDLKANISIPDLLVGIHDIAATFLHIQELQMSEDEAKKLGDAVVEVGKHYNHTVNPKVMAWINLALVGGGLYSTRYMAYKIRIDAEKGPQQVPDKPKPQPVTVPGKQAKAAGGGPAITNPSQLWNEPGESF